MKTIDQLLRDAVDAYQRWLCSFPGILSQEPATRTAVDEQPSTFGLLEGEATARLCRRYREVMTLINLRLTEAAQRDAADAALEGVQRFAECLTNGLRIAGPSEKQ